MQIKFMPPSSGGNSLLQKVVTFVITTVLVILALTFSVVLVGIVMVVGVLAWSYLWWKTRELRKRMRDFAPRAERTREHDPIRTEAMGGEVVEGEVTRVDVS